MEANEVALTGELTALEPLRHTPAGIPLTGFRLLHRSRQIEAGRERQVECEVNAVALADAALAMSGLRAGDVVMVTGFLNRRGRASAHVVLHAVRVERLEVASHGDGKVRQVQGQG